MGERASCHECRNLQIEYGGRGKIFFCCKASGRVIEAVNELAYWGTEVTPPAWCRAGSSVAGLAQSAAGEKMPARLPKVQPSWKLDVLWTAKERAAAYG